MNDELPGIFEHPLEIARRYFHAPPSPVVAPPPEWGTPKYRTVIGHDPRAPEHPIVMTLWKDQSISVAVGDDQWVTIGPRMDFSHVMSEAFGLPAAFLDSGLALLRTAQQDAP